MSARFQRAYDRLVVRFRRYHDAPRDPERVVELAAARADLDDARHDVRAEARWRGRPREPQRWIEPGTGTDSISFVGRGVAVVVAIGALVGLVALALRIGDLSERPLQFVDGSVAHRIERTDDGRCFWELDGTVRNTTDEVIRIADGTASTRFGTAVLLTTADVPPGASLPLSLRSLVRTGADGCPASVDELGPGWLRLNRNELTLRW